MTKKEPKVALALEGVRILVIEDDADALALNDLMLRRAGAHTLLASGMRQAIERFRSGVPDVLLCDLDLGESLGGCDLLRALNDVVGRAIPAIALSGAPRFQVEERVRKAGFQTFLQKPTTSSVLTRAIKAAIKSAKP
ncbi:MAG: response regulator [Polyangiaceae bacterium]